MTHVMSTWLWLRLAGRTLIIHTLLRKNLFTQLFPCCPILWPLRLTQYLCRMSSHVYGLHIIFCIVYFSVYLYVQFTWYAKIASVHQIITVFAKDISVATAYDRHVVRYVYRLVYVVLCTRHASRQPWILILMHGIPGDPVRECFGNPLASSTVIFRLSLLGSNFIDIFNLPKSWKKWWIFHEDRNDYYYIQQDISELKYILPDFTPLIPMGHYCDRCDI